MACQRSIDVFAALHLAYFSLVTINYEDDDENNNENAGYPSFQGGQSTRNPGV